MERQQAVCSRCLQRGDRVTERQNDVACRAWWERSSVEIRPVAARPANLGAVWPRRRGSGAEPFRRAEPALRGSPSVGAPWTQRERRPGVRKCHPTV